MTFKATSSEWRNYARIRKSKIRKSYFTCPCCGHEEDDATNMISNGDFDGQYYENWECGSCGKRLIVNYEGEDDSSDVESVEIDE